MKKNKLNLTLPLATTFILMVLLVVYTSALFYRITISNIYEVGGDKISGISASLGNYLDTTKSVVWVSADTVDFMVKNGESSDVILDYLKTETKNHKSQFDENYTGLYGYISGKYLDGLGWEPPEDYDPTERDWYNIAVEAGGELVIVPPYVDAQTGSVVISVSKRLSDSKDVLSLDLYTNHIQDIIEKTHINGMGYGFIVDKDATVIAHADKSKNGKSLTELDGGDELMKKLTETDEGRFETEIDGKKCTVFTETIMDQWKVVIVVDNSELFKDVYSQLAVNIATNTAVFVLIALFYYVASRKEQKSSREAEALKISEQQKAYEAQILRLEKSAADSANKAKGDFLAQMSHEIRTPINAVLGMNEMILRECEDENILEYSENIDSAGKTLLSLINSILDFSKIEDGKMEIIPARYETVSLINNTVNSVSERAKGKGLEFIVKADPQLPCALVGDDVRVTQVIVNLLTNAVKYTEQGSVTLEITCKESIGSVANIYVAVTDTGIGIREEDMGKLFESFSRIDETRNRNIEGTGLGMAIVTKLLDLMGSRLYVSSVYGKGSVFSFEIKQQIADETPIGTALDHRPEHNDRKKKVYDRYTGSRVLVTDDNDMNLKVAKNLLKLFDIKPDLAASGEETIRLMRDNKYDLVFLDHMMPKMDGIETLERLKAEDLITDDTAIIALTANAVLGAKEKYLAAGFSDYLSKPIELAALEKKLGKYLTKAPPPPQEETPPAVSGAPDGDFVKALEDKGFNVSSGLIYCMEDNDFYREMLTDYALSYEKRTGELNSALDGGEIKLYCTLIHALKSTSRTIGADDVSELAKELEFAAKADDIALINSRHGEVISLFDKRVRQIKSALGL